MNRIASGRTVSSMAAVALACCACTTLALAAKPSKGATYSGQITVHRGTITRNYPISLKVSASGRQVASFDVSLYPVYCEGGGFGAPVSKTARISSKGTFRAALPLVFAPTHQNQGSLVVSGRFGPHHSLSGKVTTDFSKSTSCNGTARFHATAR